MGSLGLAYVGLNWAGNPRSMLPHKQTQGPTALLLSSSELGLPEPLAAQLNTRRGGDADPSEQQRKLQWQRRHEFNNTQST
ncbi:hypothetical protein V6N11_048139 [Hibiscus sabdariffa]|uniref:Uncharacterized protein n=2 Tax=Hibiscus sabdariffa TaxID=183260 RepID=A0ABR1Z7D9_9ROSI